jgi:hypothetical protein
MTPAQVRKLALSLPEATEEPHFAMWSFRVRGKIFATVPPEGGHLHIFVDGEAVRVAVADDPKTFGELWWGKKLAGLRVTLATARPVAVRELLYASWRCKAPKRLVAAFEARRDEPSPR